jgi:very-short-patch-repair endonuclease
VPIGPYIADFVCIAVKLIIELDGPPHEALEQQLHDLRRDAWLRANGWHVLRFSNDIVIGGGDISFEKIARTTNALSAPSVDAH